MSGRTTRMATAEPRWLRYTLTALGLGFLFFFLGLPLIAVFVEAFAGGYAAYSAALADREALSAIGLTVLIAVVVLPFNIAVGVAAAWAIAKFDFRGKSLLITLIDLPFAVSPVVVRPRPTSSSSARRAGMASISPPSSLAPRPPGLADRAGYQASSSPSTGDRCIATMFVTFPFIARELIPLMQAAGQRRGIRRHHPRRLRLADLPARHPAQHQVGPLLRRHPLLTPAPWANLAPSPSSPATSAGETNTLPAARRDSLQRVPRSVGAFAASSVLALLALVTLVAQDPSSSGPTPAATPEF